MKKYVLIISMAAFFLNACQNEVDLTVEKPIDLESLVRPVEPEINFEFNTPNYPIEIVYLLQKEFENQKLSSGLSSEGSSKIAYLEKRVLELFPEKGYKGMLLEDQKLFDNYLRAYEEYEEELKIYEERMGIESLEEQPAASINIEHTKSEAELFNELDAMVTNKKVTREELDAHFGGVSGRGSVLGSNGLIIDAALVLLARNRAFDLAIEHYGNHNAGTRGDAFKHIYSSMHLRRYASKAVSKFVMETYETWVNPNDQARDTQMDFHNNVIGRDTRYDLFRGSLLGDLNDWRQWGRNVRDYLNYCTNGIPMDQLHNWDDNPPSSSQAIYNISSQPYNNIRYVYYVNTCYVSPCWGVNCATGYMCVNGSCIPDPNYGGCPNVRCPPGSVCSGGTCIEL